MPSLALAAGSAGEHLHLGQKVALYLQNFGLPDWVTLVLVSAMPAIELRGGVPIGNWMGAHELIVCCFTLVSIIACFTGAKKAGCTNPQ